MVDVGTQHHHNGILEVGHIHLSAFVGTTDSDFGSVILRVDHIESTGHRRGGLPLCAVAGLGSTHFHGAFFTRKGQNVAFQSGRALYHFEGHGETRGGSSL